MEEEEVGHDDDGVGAGEGQGRRRRRRRRRGNDDDGDDEAPAYEGEVRGTMTRGEGAGGGTYRYRRGEEDGALAEKQGAGLGPMAEEEVRRINEERRKRMKAGGFTNWVLRRKGKGNGGGAAGVR